MLYLLIIIFVIFSPINVNSFSQNELQEANTLFARDIYKQIVKTNEGNFLMSPFSAVTMLAFTRSGCKDKTAEEICSVLHIPNDKDKVEEAFKIFLPKLESKLHTANKMYVKENYSIRNEFKNVASSVYQSDVEPIDFIRTAEAANTINNWVEQNTNNKIKNLMDKNELDEYTQAVIINALYFKADWSNPFMSALTKQKSFYKTQSEVLQVKTIHHYKQFFKYYECPHLKAKYLELPFEGDQASFVIVLPNEQNGLSSLENDLNRVFSPEHQLQAQMVNVALPKFKIESSINLEKILKNLGVKKAFDPSGADLSGIAGEKAQLYLNKIAQKSFIDVSEQGVEAAAATFASMSEKSLILEEPKNFIADHPFIFYIKVNGVIIFVGRVIDPTKN